MGFTFEDLKELWAEQDRVSDALRRSSPVLWWLKYRVPVHFYAVTRWVAASLPWFFRNLPRRLRQGFWDSDCWGLDTTIAKYTLPRLRRLREMQHGHPGDVTWEQWQWILHDIEKFLEWHVERDHGVFDAVAYERGGALFGKYFGHLWD